MQVCVCACVCTLLHVGAMCQVYCQLLYAVSSFCLLYLALYEVSEALIVRDLIFTFQGIDGKYIQFNQDQDGFRVHPEVS